MRWALKRSVWIYHVNTGSCNNCDIELLASLTPRFDAERFGIVLVGSPRHADVLVVTGPVTMQAAPRLKHIYEQTPKPCAVVALGACGCSCGIFAGSYHIAGPVDRIIPVDVYVPGCPPNLETIIMGIVKATEKL